MTAVESDYDLHVGWEYSNKQKQKMRAGKKKLAAAKAAKVLDVIEEKETAAAVEEEKVSEVEEEKVSEVEEESVMEKEKDSSTLVIKKSWWWFW